MMKRTIFAAAALVLTSASAMAGGLLTNYNQNAAYLRNIAQDGTITLTSIYANPAGGAFLSDGWHLSLNSQTAKQQRNITTTFPLFGYNVNDRNQTHEFKGKAFAPVIPSITASYNHGKWSVSGHFGLIGGGGKCKFDDGIGSFEALYAGQLVPGGMAAIPMVNAGVKNNVEDKLTAAGVPSALLGMSTINPNSTYAGYSMNKFMEGRSYYFGLQLGATYKFKDNFSGFFGLRGVYGTCNYNGYVQDVASHFNYTYDYTVPAVPGMFPGASDNGSGSLSQNADMNLSLDCDQTGFGITPIIGFDYELNKHWNFSAKFEAPTKMSLKNSSKMNAVAQAQAADPTSPLAQFKDGEKVREDIPGILAFGAQYSPVEKARISAGFHEYFDKSAKKFGNKQDLLDHNTWEVNCGVEYDCHKLITVSASYQHTSYGLSDAYMNDVSFNNTNDMIGFGVRIHASKKFNIDLGYMHTFYQDRTVTTATAAGPKVDTYVRKNDVAGIGFNFAL